MSMYIHVTIFMYNIIFSNISNIYIIHKNNWNILVYRCYWYTGISMTWDIKSLYAELFKIFPNIYLGTKCL